MLSRAARRLDALPLFCSRGRPQTPRRLGAYRVFREQQDAGWVSDFARLPEEVKRPLGHGAQSAVYIVNGQRAPVAVGFSPRGGLRLQNHQSLVALGEGLMGQVEIVAYHLHSVEVDATG